MIVVYKKRTQNPIKKYITFLAQNQETLASVIVFVGKDECLRHTKLCLTYKILFYIIDCIVYRIEFEIRDVRGDEIGDRLPQQPSQLLDWIGSLKST